MRTRGNQISPSAKMSAGVYLLFFLASVIAVVFKLRIPPVPKQRVKRLVGKCLEKAISHRADTPENTLAGIRQASKKGAMAVEVDVQFTRDGVPVLMHDECVNRTSDGCGRLREMTLEEAKRLDVGYKFG